MSQRKPAQYPAPPARDHTFDPVLKEGHAYHRPDLTGPHQERMINGHLWTRHRCAEGGEWLDWQRPL